jgi:hypothetical protein
VDLQDVADELYGVLPGDFISTRGARAKEAKVAGEPDLAKAITALPKPAAGAWVVNMLARHRTEEIEQVLTLGAALRDAQENLDAGQMRELTTQRRKLTAAITRTARALAAELGNPVSATVAEQVESTLHAAMVDQGAADAVRAGQLTKPLEATGFGAVDVTSAMASKRSGTARPATPSRPELSVVPDDTRAREEAQERAREAAADLEEAESSAREARHRVEELSARNLELVEQLEELRRQLASREHDLEELEGELSEAETEQEAEDEALEDARQAAKEARRALDAFS